MNIAYTFNYNADGQMQKISMKVDGKDDEGSYSESGEINYTYNNKVLEKIEAIQRSLSRSDEVMLIKERIGSTFIAREEA